VITSKSDPCELLRRVALPLQKSKVIAKEDFDLDQEEEEERKLDKKNKKRTTDDDDDDANDESTEEERGKTTTTSRTTRRNAKETKLVNATTMERLYVKNFSADTFWFSIDGKLHNGKALKRAIPLGTFFEFAREGLSRETWMHLENEGKAKSLIRTVPDKCPNKELFAEFVLLRLVEVCDIAQTTKKGWTDKGWAQCRFELIPMFGSHSREGERDELVLNVLVEAALHRLRVSKLAPSDGTGLKIHMRYEGFRSSVGHRLALEDGVSDRMPDANKQQQKIEKDDGFTKRKKDAKSKQSPIVSTKVASTAKPSPRSRKPSPSKVKNDKRRKRTSPIQKRWSPPPPPLIVVGTEKRSQPSLSEDPQSSLQDHSKEGDSTNCLKSSFATEAGPGTAAAAAATLATTINRSKNGERNRIATPTTLWDLSDGEDYNKDNPLERAITRRHDDTLFATADRRRLADRIDYPKNKRPVTEAENVREDSPKKPRTPADTILEPAIAKNYQDMKDIDSAYPYQKALHSVIERVKTAAIKKSAGDAKNSNGSNSTERFDNSLELDKSTEENDDANDDSTEEDIAETDVEDAHDINKRRKPFSASQNKASSSRELFSSEEINGRGQMRILPLEQILGRVDKKASYARRPSIGDGHTERDQLLATKKNKKVVANQRSKHKTARKMAKPYHNQRKSPPLPEDLLPMLVGGGHNLDLLSKKLHLSQAMSLRNVVSHDEPALNHCQEPALNHRNDEINMNNKFVKSPQQSSRDDVAVDALLALNGNAKASYETITVNATNTAFGGGAKDIVQVGINDAVQYSDAELRVQIQTERILFFDLRKRSILQAAAVRASTRNANKNVLSTILSRGITVNMDNNEGTFLRNMLEFANMSRLHMDAQRVLWHWRICLDEMRTTKIQRDTMEHFVHSKIRDGKSKWPNKEIQHFDSFVRNDGEYWNLMTLEKCETMAELVAYRAYERAMKVPEVLLEMKVLRSLIVEFESDLQHTNCNADIREQIRYDYNMRIRNFLKVIDNSIY